VDSVELALSDPALFHGALLLAGMHWYWINGDLAVIQETYLYHKLEAIRLVNEQLADPSTSSGDSAMGTIACLALAEVSRRLRLPQLHILEIIRADSPNRAVWEISPPPKLI
jgi:hypothetical protein